MRVDEIFSSPQMGIAWGTCRVLCMGNLLQFGWIFHKVRWTQYSRFLDPDSMQKTTWNWTMCFVWWVAWWQQQAAQTANTVCVWCIQTMSDDGPCCLRKLEVVDNFSMIVVLQKQHWAVMVIVKSLQVGEAKSVFSTCNELVATRQTEDCIGKQLNLACKGGGVGGWNALKPR